jgi:type IV secretory pathway VirJ component
MIRLVAIVALAAASLGFTQVTPEERTVSLGGNPQTVYLYKPARPTGAVVLASGDLGWAGLVVVVAEDLVSQNIAVLGLNSRAYLASFTTGSNRLNVADVPGHFEALTLEAARSLGVNTPPVLVGISEGAGLSVIAASDGSRKAAWAGVIAMGLPASTELGWRTWRDWTVWVTKRPPDEPMAESAEYMGKVAVPFVSIQSTHDEFVPLATAKSLFAAAPEPKRLFLIDASNHRFSDKRDELRLRLSEALQWLTQEHK